MGKDDYLQEVKKNLPIDKLRTFYRDHFVEVSVDELEVSVHLLHHELPETRVPVGLALCFLERHL